MKRVCMGILVLGLTACQAKTPDVASVRDPMATISSQANVTADRLVGDWVVRVSWRGTPNLVTDGVVENAPSGGGANMIRVRGAGKALRLSGFEARRAGSGEVVLAPFSADVMALGQGRLRPSAGTRFGDADILVLWMDADNRTAAIGTPDGRFGWIMDRKATGGSDRIAAAKQIMEWMGYDMSLARE